MSEPLAENSPRLTEQVTGHDAAEKAFLEAYQDKRLHHGWLITGPRGVGKASLAWRIAKFVVSQDEGGVSSGLFGDELPAETLNTDPDHPAVRRILSGAHADVTLLECSADPKTGKMRKEISVAQVRELIDRYNQTSAEGGWRIAIIDAVDEMNRSAANALLKLLEEPPAKSLLFLVSHAPGRLLPTIRSRCRTLALKPLDHDSVTQVISQKFPDASPNDLTLAAQLADGAPGRAIELLSSDGLSLYRTLVQSLDDIISGRMMAAHRLADQLSSAKANSQYKLFRQLFTGILERTIRTASGAGTAHAAPTEENALIHKLATSVPLDRWLDLWDKVSERMDRTDAVNLDRRQVIIGLMNDLYECSQR